MSTKTYQVEATDVEWYQRSIRCFHACPTHINAGKYAFLISEGRFEEAYKVIKSRNPFPSVCGRVCHHPCEFVCKRREEDESIAINPLKRFISDYVRDRKKDGSAEERAALFWKKPTSDPQKPKVAVVGSGPSGLTAAQDLAFSGYAVTVFEALSAPGGMMLTGIPSYRLPKEILREEIQEILDLGVELKVNAPVGRDLTLEELKKKGYQAVYLAIGAQARRSLSIEGADLEGVWGGVEFLKEINLGRPPSIGKKVIVIGGGNVAVDVALCSLRIGAEEVEMFCLEKREEMPAHEWEVDDALEESVTIKCSWGPQRFEGKEGKVRGVSFKRCTSVFDTEGRFNPSYDEEETISVSADTVIVAIGQAADLSFLGEESGLETFRDIALKADEVTLETSLPSVFAGGDGVTGPKSVVEAISHGHEAALSIDRYFKGENLREGRVKETEESPPHSRDRAFELKTRQKEKKIPVCERKGNWKEITLGLSEAQAREEAERCLECFFTPAFDSEKCILCGACMDVCPAYCLKMVRLEDLEGDQKVDQVVKESLGFTLKTFKEDSRGAGEGTAIIKDDDRCLHCRMCEIRCPTGAIITDLF
jgi:NADPH-dependent glutamate synthase beta subunit-like oxidoreductase